MGKTYAPPDYVPFHRQWTRAKYGRRAKKQLAKARRRHAKMLLRGKPTREPIHWETEVGNRGW